MSNAAARARAAVSGHHAALEWDRDRQRIQRTVLAVLRWEIMLELYKTYSIERIRRSNGSLLYGFNRDLLAALKI